jgi:LysM repeat protein
MVQVPPSFPAFPVGGLEKSEEIGDVRRAVIALVAFGLLVNPLVARAEGPIVYVVQPGENLFRIGLRYGLTAQQIASANHLGNVSQVHAGQRLTIPSAGAASAPTYSPASTARSYHVVGAGENLFRVALRYGISVQALAAANNLANVSQVYVGQRLLIPGRAALAPAGRSVLLSVPVLAQAHSLTCEAAAARMVAAYLGKPTAEAWIQDQLGKDGNPHQGFRGDMDAEFGGIVNYGVYAEPVAQALRSLGLNADVRYNIGYADLRAALDNGQPVIVWLSQFAAPGYFDQPGGYRLVPGEHSYVIVGYDAAGLIVNDPLNGGRQFHIRAIPHWELFNNMALIASKT